MVREKSEDNNKPWSPIDIPLFMVEAPLGLLLKKVEEFLLKMQAIFPMASLGL